jgi:hypothetical protein
MKQAHCTIALLGSCAVFLVAVIIAGVIAVSIRVTAVHTRPYVIFHNCTVPEACPGSYPPPECLDGVSVNCTDITTATVRYNTISTPQSDGADGIVIFLFCLCGCVLSCMIIGGHVRAIRIVYQSIPPPRPQYRNYQEAQIDSLRMAYPRLLPELARLIQEYLS